MIDVTKEAVDEIEQPFIQKDDHENETVCQSLCNATLWKLVIYALSELIILFLF